MKLKIFFSIVGIIVVILVLGVSASLSVSGSRLRSTLESDMSLVAHLASAIVSDRLLLLRGEARNIIQEVDELPTKALPDALSLALERNGYLSIDVFERDRLIASASVPGMVPPDLGNNAHVRAALRGETVVASPEMAGNTLVLRIYANAGERLLVLSVPGSIIRDLLQKFNVLDSGNIFVIARDGVMLAYHRLEAVEQGWNLVYLGRHDPNYRGLNAIAHRMVGQETGIGYYAFEGVERLCAFLPVPESDGWSLGVAVPLRETALIQVRDLLFAMGAMLLALGALAAFFATRVLARPFETIARQNRSLVELKQAADQASDAKSCFIANTSHEIRTPLNSIVGFSELALGREDLPEEVESYLEKIYNAGMELLSIINDLLDISKIEAGKLELVPVVYDVPSMINDTGNLNLLRIADKPIRFILSVDESMPYRLEGDEIRIKQIFNNLLSNAFKYTREGTVEWSLSCERDGDAVWLTSSVRDSGIGIREGDIDKLFTNYAQVDVRSNRHIEGTGLGLPITRRLVKMMQGTIRVESRHGEGSTFTVRLRQKFVSDATIGASVAENLGNFNYTQSKRKRSARLARVHLPHARVLVVDDVKTNLDVARGIMKPYGMQIDCVRSGADAVRAVREEKVRYDAIFMDHMMPSMDGIEATHLIRERIGTEYAKTVPIIALTANAIVGNEDMFLENGFQAFLSKPIDTAQLDAIIRRWIADDVGHAPEEPAAQHSIDGLDWEKGCRRFGGDESVYIDILRSYAAHMPELLEKIRVPDAETSPDYAIVVHGIKGSSYGIEATRVGRCAEALERAVKDGDFALAREKNPELVRLLEALLVALNTFLGLDVEEDVRECRERPDENRLREMREAVRDFDGGALEAAFAELARFRYVEGEALMQWLRPQVARLNFVEIRQRLDKEADEIGDEG